MKIIKAKGFKKNVIELLESEQLPVNDLLHDLENFLVVLENNIILGTIGIEVYGNYALLRSLVVKNEQRNMGFASTLISKIEEMAIGKNIMALFLLTETASEYFSKKGYHTIERKDVPYEVQQSSEFSYVCPQSAVVMTKQLR